ncbi:MAG: TonB-dependent receptor [Woeseiaceae bacterium]|nr:TonB-dependent receptor [Woeseiaceae bacterium]
MTNKTYKATALSAAVAVALGTAPPTLAQEEQIEEVIVTGSHIRRTEYEGRAPIQIVDAGDIELTGAQQPVELLKELTVNSGSQFYNETNDRAGVSQFNIRNLGLGSTLTLINGKRAGIAPVADAGGADFVDINQFPLAMIERIEVLTDGASATYGSQAVAGVANIITRKGFEGFEISGGYADASADIENYYLNLAAGSQFDNGGFNIYATWYEQGHLERSEFDWMQNRLIGQGDISRSRFLSSTGSPGTYRRATLDPVTGEAMDVTGADNTPDADCLAAGGVFLNPADIGGQDSICRYHFVDQVSVISAEERFQVFAEFDWEFSPDVRFYNESSFSSNNIQRDDGGGTFNTGSAVGGGFTILPSHPFNFFIEDPGNPEALIWIGPENWDPAIHTAATLRAIARPLGADVNNNEKTQVINREFDYRRILNGFEFNIGGDWVADFSHMWAKSTLVTDGAHNYRSDIFQQLVRDGVWNPFGTRLSDPTLVSPKLPADTGECAGNRPNSVCTAGNPQNVLEQFDQRNVSTDRVVEQIVDLVVAGELFEFGNNPVSAAFGAQYREQKIDIVPDSLSAAGESNEESISGAVKGRQTVTAVFGEVLIPVSDFVDVNIALRNEDYGGGISTTDPKFSFEFAATESIAFRGSWGTSFQAPTVRQTASASSSAFLDDPASPGPGPQGAVCVNAGLNNNVAVVVSGAPDLQPQESENFNIGAIWQGDALRVSVDYWNFDYTDLIAQDESPQAIVINDCLDDGIPNDPRVTRDAGGQLRQVDTQFTNIGAVKTDGIDVNADYNMDLWNGNLTIDLGATWVSSFEVDQDGSGNFVERAGSRNFLNSFSTMPELRANLGGTYVFGDNTVAVFGRYIDSYVNDQSNDAPVASYTTWDAQYSRVFSGLLGDGETTLTLGVNNIADKNPPALRRFDGDGNFIERFADDGTYERGWIDRPGYDDRAGHDLRGRIVYLRFKHAF